MSATRRKWIQLRELKKLGEFRRMLDFLKGADLTGEELYRSYRKLLQAAEVIRLCNEADKAKASAAAVPDKELRRASRFKRSYA